MRALTAIQSAWAVVMGLAGTLLASIGNPNGFALIAVAILYGYAILSLHRLERWAWWFCCVVAVAPILVVAPSAIYNVALFVMNNPLYLDSPGTILVVAIDSLVLVVPAILVLFMLLSKRGLLSRDKSPEQAREG